MRWCRSAGGARDYRFQRRWNFQGSIKAGSRHVGLVDFGIRAVQGAGSVAGVEGVLDGSRAGEIRIRADAPVDEIREAEEWATLADFLDDATGEAIDFVITENAAADPLR